ncbi:histidine phosphotransferase family protein [Brevundimonas sp. 2R-24]|uniref:Histidine phosphotransferase family protein n=1 Tax=Peiella sedimenti TaxID=3061083 RepID=A0ABT8SHZ4_9CAUL|nr:histidine phosphotransferase family protein [Caulobacteraceae bacterium XZ-24]
MSPVPAPGHLTAPDGSPSADELATLIAAKLCHDFISPSGAIVSGLDLLKDPSAQDMREEAMGLVEASARKLVKLVHFARVAFGAATTSERFSSEELETLAQGVFEDLRANLTWTSSAAQFGKPQARAALNLAQLAGGCLPSGGTATLTLAQEGGALVMTAVSEGPRARFKAEAVAGLSGEPVGDGMLAGQWTQPYWLFHTVRAAGGELSFETGQDRVDIRIRMPA